MSKPRQVGYRREIGWFGSFALGYGDVGPNIFIALGVITLYAGGAAPIAFLIAAVLYATVGLMYAELGPTYPYSGGVHVYGLKAFNSVVSFVAGWAMLLAYIICISLFAVAAAGYLRQLLPVLMFPDVTIMGVSIPSIGVLAGLLASLLILLNIVGIKYSAFMVSALVFVGLSIEALILSTGFLLKFDPQLFLRQITEFGSPQLQRDVAYLPLLPVETNNFLYAITLAMASFVGIESISQAAEETRRPHISLPKAAKMVVVVVAASAIAFPVLAVGSTDWRVIAAAYENPVYTLVSTYPYLAEILMPLVALAAFILCYSSSNTGVVGVSRLTASMGRFRLLPAWLQAIHPKFRTPVRTILIFGGIGVGLAFLGDVTFLASVYAFSAVISYLILGFAYFRLRRLEKTVYSPWCMPLCVNFRGREVPVLALMEVLGMAVILGLMALFHAVGRVMALLWVGGGLMFYALYRKRAGMKILSRDEAVLVEPLSYRIKVGVLIRPYENMETAYRSIKHSFDRRFDLFLVTVVEPSRWFGGELEKVDEDVVNDLEMLEKRLKHDKYVVDRVVAVGEFEEKVSELLDSEKVDLVAYIQRRPEKSALEKGHEVNIHNLLSKYPGRVISLKRVGE